MKHISLEDYFGVKINHPDATPERVDNAKVMLVKVNALLLEAQEVGKIRLLTDPDTGTVISGSKGGAGDGGFRLQTSATGAPRSKHREGHAVDVYDPANLLDDWIGRNLLIKHGLWREVRTATVGWAHLQDVPPKSGNRSYIP